jgi:hypothetical protein
MGEYSPASAKVWVSGETAGERATPDHRSHSLGDEDWLILARDPRTLWPMVQRGRAVLPLVQRREMGAHPAGFAGASSSSFLLCVRFISVTVVLGVVSFSSCKSVWIVVLQNHETDT